ncbi:ATP-binding protein [Streptomyces erythrochromogenes]|uniref:ATP-binding protein n=1 Tax=Streptomyces erythrochromogenes TaxID=285574 RepID=UPI003431F52E
MAAQTKQPSFTRLARMVGLSAERLLPPARLVAVYDGVVVTDTAAWAYFTLASSNTDLMATEAQDAEQDAASTALAKVLAGYDAHLKILWSQQDGASFRDEAHRIFTAGDVAAVAEMWAARLNQLALPQRHLLLGVKIATRDTVARANAKSAVVSALGLAAPGLPKSELLKYDGLARRLGRRLEATPWRASLAPAENLAWAISRESFRPQSAPPHLPPVGGASLVRLAQSHVEPHADHVRIINAQGTTAAWVAVMAMPTFPHEITTPGEQEWLRCLSEIRYIPAGGNGDEVLVCPEASVRWTVLQRGDALKAVNKVRATAKEQRNSAAENSAGQTSTETEESEAIMEELRRGMTRDGLTLVEDHPRIIVSSTVSVEDLRARCDAVTSHYADLAIDCVIATEEQRDLWLEAQIGDTLRVTDLGHIRETGALAASMWWGGSEAGDDSGPIAGFLTGTTPGMCRLDVTAGSARGDATTTILVGRSGRGKTTAMMMAQLTAAQKGAFALMLGFKGDEGGLIRAGRYLGLSSHQVTASAATPAVADLYRLLPKDDAALEVVSQLLIILPQRMRDAGVETQLLKACNAVGAGPDPATWRVVELLSQSEDPLARQAGTALAELARTQLGAPLLGQPEPGASPLRPDPGVWLVQVPGLKLPKAGTPPADMTLNERVSLALMRGLIAYALHTASRPDLRGLPKGIFIPEVHVLTATDDGRRFLDYIARTGRALDTALVLDTQDPSSLLGLDGVLEATTTVAAFETSTRPQQDALSELLRLPVGESSRALLRTVGKDAKGEIVHGHCVVRDRRDRVATMQWDVPDEELLRLLSTNPKDQADQHEAEQHAADSAVPASNGEAGQAEPEGVPLDADLDEASPVHRADGRSSDST